MNQQAMMRQIKKLQKEMMDTQAEIEQTEFTACIGPVTVVMLGNKLVQKVTIDKEYTIDGVEDLELLEDSIVAANNQLIGDIERFTEQKMSKYKQFLGGFGGF